MAQTETPSPTAPLARMTPTRGTALPMPCPPGHCDGDLVLAPVSIMWYGADGPGALTVDGLPVPPSGPMRVRLARVIW